MKLPVFEGTATALVTPFKQGTVDYAAFDLLLDTQLAAAVDAVVVCGTTGEASTMTDAERLGLIAHTVQYLSGRCKVIAGTGTNDTAHTLQLSRVAASMGVDAILLVTPYYNKCTQGGLAAHFCSIADQVTCPVIVYSVPSRTGMEICPATCALLARHPNINGIKDAGGNLAKTAEILHLCGDTFHVWSGCDELTAPMMCLGAKGVISVCSNVAPKRMKQLTDLCLDGNFREAGRTQVALTPLISALFCEVNPIPVKKALQVQGLDVGVPRMPLTELSEPFSEPLRQALQLAE